VSAPPRGRHWLSGFREKETWTAYLFVFPWIFGFLFFTLGPMIFSAYYSFTNYGIE
jgi:multiple sugar transport system permease protein